MTKLQYHKNDTATLHSKHPSLAEVDVMARKYNPLHDEEIAATLVRQLQNIGHFFGSHH